MEFNLNANGKNIPDMLGISDSRADEIIQIATRVDETTETQTEQIVRTIDEVGPILGEMVYVGYILGRMAEKQVQLQAIGRIFDRTQV